MEVDQDLGGVTRHRQRRAHVQGFWNVRHHGDGLPTPREHVKGVDRRASSRWLRRFPLASTAVASISAREYDRVVHRDRDRARKLSLTEFPLGIRRHDNRGHDQQSDEPHVSNRQRCEKRVGNRDHFDWCTGDRLGRHQSIGRRYARRRCARSLIVTARRFNVAGGCFVISASCLALFATCPASICGWPVAPRTANLRLRDATAHCFDRPRELCEAKDESLNRYGDLRHAKPQSQASQRLSQREKQHFRQRQTRCAGDQLRCGALHSDCGASKSRGFTSRRTSSRRARSRPSRS